MVFLESSPEGVARIPYNLESTGTIKLYALMSYFYHVMKEESTVMIDEIDSGIHDLLLKSVIDSLGNKMKGQLIITTHNMLLLKNEYSGF